MVSEGNSEAAVVNKKALIYYFVGRLGRFVKSCREEVGFKQEIFRAHVHIIKPRKQSSSRNVIWGPTASSSTFYDLPRWPPTPTGNQFPLSVCISLTPTTAKRTIDYIKYIT